MKMMTVERIEPFSDTEQKIVDLMMDGEPRNMKQLKLAWDEFAEDSALSFHLSNIRRKLPQHGLLLGMISGPAGPIYRIGRLITSRG